MKKMRKVSVLVGAEIGAAMGWDKAPCLTTEYAHRWNSYGLQHVMVIEDDTDQGSDKEGLRGDSHG